MQLCLTVTTCQIRCRGSISSWKLPTSRPSPWATPRDVESPPNTTWRPSRHLRMSGDEYLCSMHPSGCQWRKGSRFPNSSGRSIHRPVLRRAPQRYGSSPGKMVLYVTATRNRIAHTVTRTRDDGSRIISLGLALYSTSTYRQDKQRRMFIEDCDN